MTTNEFMHANVRGRRVAVTASCLPSLIYFVLLELPLTGTSLDSMWGYVDGWMVAFGLVSPLTTLLAVILFVIFWRKSPERERVILGILCAVSVVGVLMFWVPLLGVGYGH